MKLLTILMLGLVPSALLAGTQDLGDFDRSQTYERTLFEDETGLIRGGGEFEGRVGHELGDISAGGSVGIAFDEVGFLATGEVDFWITRFLSVGPLLQLNVGQDIFLLIGGGPKFTVDFTDNEVSKIVKPYVHFGPALAVGFGDHGHRKNHRGHDDGTEVGLGLVLGAGVDFYLWEDISLGTGILWNWLVTAPIDERFYFGWKVFEFKFHF